jgi:hypothetical protein
MRVDSMVAYLADTMADTMAALTVAMMDTL